jgi:hypothetical protein
LPASRATIRWRKVRAGARVAPSSRPVTAAPPESGFAHERGEIDAAVDGIRIANFPEQTAAALKMSVRMPQAARSREALLMRGGSRYVMV